MGPLCQYISLMFIAFFQVVAVSQSLPLLWEEDHELGDRSSSIVWLICPSMPGHLLWYCMLASTSILSWGAVFDICQGIVVLDLTPPPPSVCWCRLMLPWGVRFLHLHSCHHFLSTWGGISQLVFPHTMFLNLYGRFWVWALLRGPGNQWKTESTISDLRSNCPTN